jgi:choline dehydrogenase-like flavoprotein
MTMPHDADVIIVGSGPAGVSAAWPLVEAGHRVLMVDASEDTLPASPAHSSLTEWRTDPRRLEIELGKGPIAGSDVSPKFATPLSRATLGGFAEAAGIDARDYWPVGSFAAGGLSRIWGALAVPYGAADLEAFSGEAEAMHLSYRRVASRIGLSGSRELPSSDAPALTPAAAHLARRHERHPDTHDFSLSPASNAVLMTARDDRLPCTACGLCLYGCGRGSIYQSAAELPSLGRFSNFTYRAGLRVEQLAGSPGRHVIEARTGDATVRLNAPAIILAAGTLMTSSLVLRRIGHTGRSVPLQNNPVGGAAFLVPSLIGTALPHHSFGLGQLFYTLQPEEGTEAAGVFYGADTLPLAAIADSLPVTRPTALRIARSLAPALLLATGYLPGRWSENRLTVEDDGGMGRIVIEGGRTADADRLLRETFRKLGRQVRRRGVWPVPGSLRLLPAGADSHPTSTLPMGADGPASTRWSGELQGLSGVYVADGAALPVLSARHPTLTIMANADRIGRALARRLAATTVLARAG